MKKILITSLATSLLMFSCSKNDTVLSIGDSELDIKISLPADTKTKSVIYGTAFPSNSAIGVELLKFSDNSAYSSKTNIEFTTDGLGNWSSSENYILSPLKAKVYAYYPYQSLADNTLPFYSVPISVETVAEHNSDIDYMYATPVESEPAAVYNANNSINLNMNHSLTQISFIVYKDNYSGSGNLSKFFIEDATPGNGLILVNKTPSDFMMDIRDGVVTGGIEGVIERTLSTPIVIEEATTDPQFPSTDVDQLKSQVVSKGMSALIVPPGAVASGAVKFSFTIDGSTYSISNTSAINWDRGKQYIYKIKLAGTSLSLASVTITDWEAIPADDVIIQ